MKIKVGDKVRVKFDSGISWAEVISIAGTVITVEPRYLGYKTAVKIDQIDMQDTMWPDQRVMADRKKIVETKDDKEEQ